MIVQATTEPSRLTTSGLLTAPTLAWNPVVRLTARQGLEGQLGTVGGVVSGKRPTSFSVAGAAAGSASASARLASKAIGVRLIVVIQHDRAADVAVRRCR